MNKPAVLFDFDGTFMDSEPAVIASYTHVFSVFGNVDDFTDERKTEVLGPPLEVEMRKFFPDVDTATVIEEYRTFQDSHLKELMWPMPHTVEMIAKLRELGYPTGIVTSRIRSSLENILNLFSLRDYFDILVCQDDGFPSKPDPSGILYACEQLHADKCIYVGDSISDLQAGRNAGAIVIAALTKKEKEAELLSFHPDYAVRDLSDIVSFVGQLPDNG